MLNRSPEIDGRSLDLYVRVGSSDCGRLLDAPPLQRRRVRRGVQGVAQQRSERAVRKARQLQPPLARHAQSERPVPVAIHHNVT